MENDCHVIDVGISPNQIEACLALDDLAASTGKCLIQSARGSAGEQGTRDMLDMLTDRNLSPIVDCLVAEGAGRSAIKTRAFTFPSTEADYLPEFPPVVYRTKFDKLSFDLLLRALQPLRAVSLWLYRRIRNKAATQKRSTVVMGSERVHLSAVAVAEDGSVLGTTRRTFKSDYGATAAAAVAMADLAWSGHLRFGVGRSELSQLEAIKLTV